MRAQSRKSTVVVFAVAVTVALGGGLWAFHTAIRVSHRNALAAYTAPIRQAFHDLAGKISLPLAGPVPIPPGLSATTTYTKTQYTVYLYRCTTTTGRSILFPVNAPPIETSGDCSGLAQSFGYFKGQRFASAKQAKTTTLTASLWGPQSACYPHSVNEQTCGELRPRVVEIHHWRIVLGEGFADGGRARSRWQQAILHRVQITALPAPSGTIRIQAAADGNHTEIVWQRGPMVYSVWINRSSRQALRLASDYHYVHE
ncbi:MAG: hypothetical protein M1415_09920 [Firmicutes bacterium]|nr:hypothetical protein [Bacillota bacterium]